MASKKGAGFGAWFEELKEEEAGGSNEPDPFSWASLWGGEKKTDDSSLDPESKASLLDSATDFFSQLKTSANETTGLGQQDTSMFGLSYQTRFKGFVATLMMSGFFFFMAFIVGIPVIVVRPSKFALCFTLGSMLFMSSFALLKGPGAHVRSMITLAQLPFTACYLGSMGFTLYAALVARSYLLVVTSSSLQIATLGYYLLSFLPGGAAASKVFIAMFIRTAKLTATATFTILKQCLKIASS
jgi:hypothetical protein